MAEPDGPTATVFRDWLPAREVSARLSDTLGALTGRSALWDRLCAGLARAAASHMAVARGRAQPGPTWVARKTWLAVTGIVHDDLWETDQLTAWVLLDGHSQKTRFDFYDVRFEPDGVEKMLPTTPKPGARTADDDGPDGEPEDGNGPPVDRSDLEAWYDLYSKIYGAEFALPHAVRSAKGFFPDKTVGRDRVHDLFPVRKSGRKPARG